MNFDMALRLLAVMVLWASCFPLIAVGLNLAPHLAFAAMRAALAGLFLLILGAIFHRPMPTGKRAWSLILLVGLGATTFGFFGMFHAAEFVSPGLATVIANTQPLLTAVLARAFLGERLKALGMAGLAIGFLGLVAIALPGFVAGEIQGYMLGIAYIILAAAGVAAGNVAMKRLSGEVDAIVAMGLQLLLGAAPLALLSALTEDMSSVSLSGEFIVVLVILSIFGTSLAFWLWFTVLQRVALNRANAFTFLVPMFGLAIGAALFEERLSWAQAVGAVLVLTGIVLVQRDAGGKAGRTHAAPL
jgi:drug/metabolite transporter (DMT)-like permease